jgi:hypothetical protein
MPDRGQLGPAAYAFVQSMRLGFLVLVGAAAACVVTVTQPGPEPSETQRMYAADGRLLWGQTRLEYDALPEEQIRYDQAGRPVAIATRSERQARKGLCEVLGGCDEPAERTLASMQIDYDAAGRVTTLQTTTTHYRLEDGAWREGDDDVSFVHYTYDDKARLLEAVPPAALVSYAYAGACDRVIVDPWRVPRNGPCTASPAALVRICPDT